MNNQSPNSSKEYSELTSIQQQRYDYLFDIYGHSAADIVTNVFGKGPSSWPSFLEKMDAMEQAKKPLKVYYDELYNSFNLYQVYTPGQIISAVATVRRQLGLAPYTEKIKIQSENDFDAIFIYKKEVREPNGEETKENKEFIGYKPLAKVKPE